MTQRGGTRQGVVVVLGMMNLGYIPRSLYNHPRTAVSVVTARVLRPSSARHPALYIQGDAN